MKNAIITIDFLEFAYFVGLNTATKPVLSDPLSTEEGVIHTINFSMLV